MSTNFKEYKGLSLTNIADETLQFWKENSSKTASNDTFNVCITGWQPLRPSIYRLKSFLFFCGSVSMNIQRLSLHLAKMNMSHKRC